jgi:hypothetical protein
VTGRGQPRWVSGDTLGRRFGFHPNRPRVVGTFPDGESALMLVAARLRYVAGTHWGTRRYLNTALLRVAELPGEPAAAG